MRSGWCHLALLVALAAGVSCLAGCEKQTVQATHQQSFATPEEALNALVTAAGKQDLGTLRDLLGPGTEHLISSGDAIADRRERDSFLNRFHVFHELVAGDDNTLVLLVGEDRWPVPIPLVRREGRWQFDGASGMQELLLRRMGANELRTIDVMQGFVAAQTLYAASGHDGLPSGVYAQKLRSEPGKQDGLYWSVGAGQPQSPAGPLLADAASEGYGGLHPRVAPYHGYLYRMLPSQGPAANGGARDYVEDGKQTGGFALLAYPANYASSGIMTFMVNQDGVVWQRDLGGNTARTVAAISRFEPDDSWTPLAPQ